MFSNTGNFFIGSFNLAFSRLFLKKKKEKIFLDIPAGGDSPVQR
jgi:hypothetical protein